MELSAFNLTVPDFPEPGKALLYNCWTGASAVLSAGDLAHLRSLDASGDPPPPGELAALAAALAAPDVAIVVASRVAEENDFRAWFDARRADTRLLSLAVSTSFACNFACTYCYQDTYLDGTVMSHATARALARWCGERVRTTNARRLHFNVLGGEPLLHPRLVEHLARAATDEARGQGVRFTFTLITNGYFLSADLVDGLRPLGLEGVQISLDGEAVSHGTTRPTKSGENPFPRIWKNLVGVAGRVKIMLAGTYVPSTVEGFPALLERLCAAGLTAEDIVKISWKPALQAATAPHGSACGTSWADAGGTDRLWLDDRIRQAGYTPASLLDLGPCGIHAENYFAVDPGGRIFECPGFVGHPEWAVGDVWRGLDGPARARLRPESPLVECGTCSYRPRCAGGCLAVPWIRAGRAEGINCEAGYYADVADGALRRAHLRAHLVGGPLEAALQQLNHPIVPQARTGRRRLPVVR